MENEAGDQPQEFGGREKPGAHIKFGLQSGYAALISTIGLALFALLKAPRS